MPEQLYCNGKVIFLYNALSPPAKQVVFCFGHLHFSEHEKLQYPQQDKSHNKTAAEISVAVESLKPYVRASFVVDTLTYLHRGGRCSAIAAMAGGLLKLYPQIIVEHGAMKPTKKYRGKMDSVILSYVKDMEPALKHARPDRVFITHSGCEPTIINAVRSYLEGLGIFREILETRAGGVISSHCGPGTLGVLFIES